MNLGPVPVHRVWAPGTPAFMGSWQVRGVLINCCSWSQQELLSHTTGVSLLGVVETEPFWESRHEF